MAFASKISDILYNVYNSNENYMARNLLNVIYIRDRLFAFSHVEKI